MKNGLILSKIEKECQCDFNSAARIVSLINRLDDDDNIEDREERGDG